MVSLPSAIHASPVEYTLPDTINNINENIYTAKLLFPKASAVVLREFADNGAAIDSISRFFSSVDIHNLLDIKVTGTYSPEGKYLFNKKLAEARALAVGRMVRELNPAVDAEISISHPAPGHNGDYRRMRSAELRIVYRDEPTYGTPVPDTMYTQQSDDIAATEATEADTISFAYPPPKS